MKLYQFNIGLVRQLKRVLIEKLEREKEQLIKVKNNEIKLENVINETISNIHSVSNNLKMANLNEWEFVSRLESVLNLIKDKKAPPESLQVSIEVISHFKDYLESKIDKLSKTKENDFYPMELWQDWERLSNILGEKAGAFDLFYPFAEFDKEEEKQFREYSTEELKHLTLEPYKDYAQAVKDFLELKTIHDVPNAKKTLQTMYNAIDYFSNMKSKIGFQGYFIALKARLLMAYSSEYAELNKKDNIIDVLEMSLKEIQSFRNNNNRSGLPALKKALERFLIPKYWKEIAEEEIVKETLVKFNIEKFLTKAKSIHNHDEKIRKEEFKKLKETFSKINLNIITLLGTIRENLLFNLEKEKGGLPESANLKEIKVSIIKNTSERTLVFINSFLKIEKVINPSVKEVLEPLKILSREIEKDVVNFKTSLNTISQYSALIYILQKYIENNEDVNQDFLEVLKTQAKRAELSLVEDRTQKELDGEYKVYWEKIGRMEIEDSYRAIFKKFKLALNEIKEDSTNLIYKNEKEIANKLLLKTSHFLALLVMAKYMEAANLFEVVRNIIIEKIKSNIYVYSEKEKEDTIRILQIIEVFVEMLEKGDLNPNQYIKEVYEDVLKVSLEEKRDNHHSNKVEYNHLSNNDIIKTQKVKSSMSVNLVDSENLLKEERNVSVSHINKEEMVEEVKEKITENNNNDYVMIKEETPTQVEEKQQEQNEQVEIVATVNEMEKDVGIVVNEEVVENSETEVEKENEELEIIKNDNLITKEFSENVEEEQNLEKIETKKLNLENGFVKEYFDFKDGMDEILKEDFFGQWHNNLIPIAEKSFKELRNYNHFPENYLLYKKEIKRYFHTLKGDTATLGYENLKEIFTAIEALVREKVENENYLTKDFIDIYEELYKTTKEDLIKIENALNENVEEFELLINKAMIFDLIDLINSVPHEITEKQLQNQIEVVENVNDIKEEIENELETNYQEEKEELSLEMKDYEMQNLDLQLVSENDSSLEKIENIEEFDGFEDYHPSEEESSKIREENDEDSEETLILQENKEIEEQGLVLEKSNLDEQLEINQIISDSEIEEIKNDSEDYEFDEFKDVENHEEIKVVENDVQEHLTFNFDNKNEIINEEQKQFEKEETNIEQIPFSNVISSTQNIVEESVQEISKLELDREQLLKAIKSIEIIGKELLNLKEVLEQTLLKDK